MLIFNPPLIISVWESVSYTLCRKDSAQTTSSIAGMPELLPKSTLFLLVKVLVVIDLWHADSDDKISMHANKIL